VTTVYLRVKLNALKVETYTRPLSEVKVFAKYTSYPGLRANVFMITPIISQRFSR
jgi:hypothetical protein